jgi:hypothetical protein
MQAKDTKLRLEIDKLITNLVTYIDPSYKIDYVSELDDFWDKQKSLKHNYQANGLYTIKNNIVKFKSLDVEQSFNLEKLIQKLIIKNIEISPFNLKVKKEILNRTVNKKGLLEDINTFLDVTYFGQTIIFNHIEKDATVIAYKLHWEMGRAILNKLQEVVNTVSIHDALKKDFQIKDNIIFLCEALTKNTPAALNLKGHFQNMSKTFSQVNEKIVFLFIIYYVLKHMRKHVLGVISIEDLEPSMRQLTTHFYTNEMTYTSTKEVTLNVNIQNAFGNQLPNDIIRETMKRIRLNCFNIINVYAKIIGVELSDLYVNSGIMKAMKFPDGKLGYQIVSDATVMHVFHKLPSVIPLPEDYTTQQTFGKYNTQGYTQYTPLIENDAMEGAILDINIWKDSQGRFTLNFEFIKDFLKNFYYIKKKNPTEKHTSLNDSQVLFLNSYFNLNFLCLKDHPTIYNKLLSYALDFKNLDKLVLKYPKILPTILDEFINKIYQKKFLLIQILRDLPILLRLDNFCFELRFDLRGRGYPFASLFNYFEPITKYFFSWGNNYPMLSESERISCLETIATQATTINILPQELLQKKNLTLMDLYAKGITKKVFESLLLYNDAIHIKQLMYPLQYYYSVDACSSGFQLNASLLRSAKLAHACGLIGNEYKDLYSEFILYFNNSILEMHQFCKQLHTIPELMSFMTIAELFVKDYYTSLKKNNFIFQLKKDIKMYNKLLLLLNSFKFVSSDANLISKELSDMIASEKAFTYLQRRKLYKLLVARGDFKVFKKPKIKKNYSLEKLLNLTPIKATTKTINVDKTKVNLVLTLLEFLYENESLSRFKHFIPNVNRKMVKNAIMVTFYGASPKTRRASYYNVFKKQQMEAGILITKQDNDAFLSFTFYLDFKLMKWIKSSFPEALYLIDAVRQLATKKKFIAMVISSEHCSWYYQPNTVSHYSKTVYNKDYSLTKYTMDLDFNKIKSGFMANYIQFCDATICSYVISQMKSQNIPIITIHDCFKCPYQYKKQLDIAIYNAYTRFYNSNFLEKHFINHNKQLLTIINTLRINENIEPFLPNEISFNTLTKH